MRLGLTAWKGIPLILLAFLWSLPVWGAEAYKTYRLERYGCWDIVFDTYTVQEGDHIWEILCQKGCIAEDDFMRFVSILKHFNPHIKNVDMIYPGQRIMIPLKQIKAKAGVPDAGPRYFSIPMIPDVIYTTYEVRPDDCLSEIVATELGIGVEEIPEGYFQTFKALNPDIDDIDCIYPGQKIHIPEIASEEVTAAPTGSLPDPEASAPETPSPACVQTNGGHERAGHGGLMAVSKALKQIGGTVLQSGNYFFPTAGHHDFMLDLSAFPVLELANGRRILFETGEGLPQGAEEAIRAFWKSVSIINMDRCASGPALLDKVFRDLYGNEVRQTLNMPMLDEGIEITLRGDWIFPQKQNKGTLLQYHCITCISDPEERTSAALRQYLTEHDILVSDLLPGTKDEVPDSTTPTPATRACPPSAAHQANTGRTSQLQTGLKGEGSGEGCVQFLDAQDHETFVAGFVKTTGFSYYPNMPLSFNYAGCQVQTAANLICGGAGPDRVVDFGTFYGEAKSAIEAGGLKVLSIRPEDKALTIAGNILKIIGIAFSEDPVFFGANRKVSKTISISIPGLLVSHPDQERLLFTLAQLHPKMCDFLMERDITVFKTTDK
ncbi:MAG: hypothetical protein BA861_05085 [Desulfobacterales bacterium S3730MH5]|nr:MAG: hypothetical protein BA861_05085 [Desulfobacterales bacterium S3730MH5]